MNFYNREAELAQLKKMKEMAYDGHSKLTVLTGRRIPLFDGTGYHAKIFSCD